MEELQGLVFLLIILAVVVFVVMVPITIAKKRGICGSELSTITILSWIGLLIGITWIVALVLSLIWQPKNWVDKDATQNKNDIVPSKEKLTCYEMLEKLSELKEKRIITEEEFKAEKDKIMASM